MVTIDDLSRIIYKSLRGRENDATICKGVNGGALFYPPRSVKLLFAAMELQHGDHILWLGCGDGKEALLTSCLAQDIGIDISISAYEMDHMCINEANRRLENLREFINRHPLTVHMKADVEFHIKDILHLRPTFNYTHVYTTIPANFWVYRKWASLAYNCHSCRMLIGLSGNFKNMNLENITKVIAHLSSSNEQKQMKCCPMTPNNSELIGEFYEI